MMFLLLSLWPTNRAYEAVCNCFRFVLHIFLFFAALYIVEIFHNRPFCIIGQHIFAWLSEYICIRVVSTVRSSIWEEKEKKRSLVYLFDILFISLSLILPFFKVKWSKTKQQQVMYFSYFFEITDSTFQFTHMFIFKHQSWIYREKTRKTVLCLLY